MGRVTPITDQKTEDQIIVALQKGLRSSYPQNWSALDSRVGSFLNHYIRVGNAVKLSIATTTGYNRTLDGMVQMGASKTLSQNFLNEVLRQASAGAIPFWMSNPISAARTAAAQNATVRAEIVAKTTADTSYAQALKAAEGPTVWDRLFGGVSGVASSWGTAAKVLPWALILGGAAFLWFSFGQPARTASRNVARRL